MAELIVGLGIGIGVEAVAATATTAATAATVAGLTTAGWIGVAGVAAGLAGTIISAVNRPGQPGYNPMLPTTTETAVDTSAQQAAYAEAETLRKRRGAAATILTGPSGTMTTPTTLKTRLGD